MTICIHLDDCERLTRSNIEPRDAATTTVFRSVSADFDGLLRRGKTLPAADCTGPGRYGPERDHAQPDAIIRGREALTGGRTRHAVTVRSCDDLAVEAEAANAP